MKSISGLVQSQSVIIPASILVFGVRIIVPRSFSGLKLKTSMPPTRILIEDRVTLVTPPSQPISFKLSGIRPWSARNMAISVRSPLTDDMPSNRILLRTAFLTACSLACLISSWLISDAATAISWRLCSCLPLLDIGSRLGHSLSRFTPLMRFTADVRAAETEMVGGEHCGCTGGCNNNDFSSIGGYIGLMGNGWSQYRIWSRMAKMICGAMRRLSLLLGCGLALWVKKPTSTSRRA